MTLTPEETVVLACARADFSPAHRHTVRAALTQPFAWHDACTLAAFHGVAHFLHTRLLDSAADLLPQQARDHARDALTLAQAAALVLGRQQQRIADAFHQHSIPVLWLKGIPLSQRLYSRDDARQSNDLDILIHPQDFPAVAGILLDLGFCPDLDVPPGTNEHPQAGHHQNFRRAGEFPVLVEVHTRLAGPIRCQPPVRDLFARSVAQHWSGRALLVPCPEDDLLLLALHAHQHNFGKLRCLMDVRECQRRYQNQINEAELRKLAARRHCTGRLMAASLLACRVFDDPPGKFRQGKLRFALKDLDAKKLLDPRGEADDRRRLLLLLAMDSWLDSWRSLAPYLFPPADYARAILPPHRPRFLARPAHWSRLLRGFLSRAASS